MNSHSDVELSQLYSHDLQDVICIAAWQVSSMYDVAQQVSGEMKVQPTVPDGSAVPHSELQRGKADQLHMIYTIWEGEIKHFGVAVNLLWTKYT